MSSQPHSPSSEKLRAQRDERGVWKDQYGRDAGTCLASEKLAGRYAADVHEAAAALREGRILLGRLGGTRQLGRLEQAARLFERVAERDRAFGAELERLNERGEEL